MDILYLLIPLSVVLVFMIAVFFWWSLRSDQYEDLDGSGYRILMDDDSAHLGEKSSGPAAGGKSGTGTNSQNF